QPEIAHARRPAQGAERPGSPRPLRLPQKYPAADRLTCRDSGSADEPGAAEPQPEEASQSESRMANRSRVDGDKRAGVSRRVFTSRLRRSIRPKRATVARSNGHGCEPRLRYG